ncbi:hypothetical protein [Stenotrophomonas maltophilia]|uniref:hypothetical protein n=1 Tax=Stenotrophomonas maltophilia TaxID=40324 RepID=UPI0015F2078B|nr:hypothetical protein [Stenotrophomonas maltophilia]QDY50429.1 hypothetical protein DUW70_18855 [Stenotrophomonas maltophilia]
MQVDTFGAYVRAELEYWGVQFALHRDCDYLGHHSRSLLQALIDYKGDLPGRAQGFKPMAVDARAQRVEDLVTVIARDNKAMSCVLRARFCGKGRVKNERYETAQLLLANAGEPMMHVKAYLELARRGEDRIHGMLAGIALAA